MALAGALGIFVAAVLPAEYDVDPLGTGRLLGIAKMADPGAGVAPPAQDAAVTELVQAGPLTHYPAAFNEDTVEFVLEPFDYVEYKYALVKGAALTFAWKATGIVEHDFHGEPDVDPEGGLQSYDKSKKLEASGSLVAPFTGIHGWYWRNPSDVAVTVKISSAGLYTSGLEIKSDGSKQSRIVTPANVVPSPAP